VLRLEANHRLMLESEGNFCMLHIIINVSALFTGLKYAYISHCHAYFSSCTSCVQGVALLRKCECEISDSYLVIYEDGCLLGCCAVESVNRFTDVAEVLAASIRVVKHW
jgi:hypothetical protein